MADPSLLEVRNRWQSWAESTLGGTPAQIEAATEAAMQASVARATQEDTVNRARAAWTANKPPAASSPVTSPRGASATQILGIIGVGLAVAGVFVPYQQPFSVALFPRNNLDAYHLSILLEPAAIALGVVVLLFRPMEGLLRRGALCAAGVLAFFFYATFVFVAGGATHGAGAVLGMAGGALIVFAGLAAGA